MRVGQAGLIRVIIVLPTLPGPLSVITNTQPGSVRPSWAESYSLFAEFLDFFLFLLFYFMMNQ